MSIENQSSESFLKTQHHNIQLFQSSFQNSQNTAHYGSSNIRALQINNKKEDE